MDFQLGGIAYIRSVCLERNTHGELFETRLWNFKFHKVWGILLLAEELSAFKQELFEGNADMLTYLLHGAESFLRS